MTYYLHSQGSGATPRGDGTLDALVPGDEPTDQFTYDARDPVPSLLNFIRQPTPRDQRLLAHRRDILVFQSAPLPDDVLVIGIPWVVLYVASTARDTDFFVRLIDVHPNGLAVNVCMGVMRARYRNGLDSPVLLPPDEPVKLEIQMLPTANRFFAGHRIRVDITSSDFPNFDRNHNTGGDDYQEARLEVARNNVFHDRQRPSSIELPTIES